MPFGGLFVQSRLFVHFSVFAGDKLLCVGELLDFLAELPPFRKPVVFPLAVNCFQAAVIGGETRGEVKAAGVAVKQPQIVLRVARFVVAVFKVVHYVDNSWVNIFVILLCKVEFCNAVHSGLA